jgi:hypothetical protein
MYNIANHAVIMVHEGLSRDLLIPRKGEEKKFNLMIAKMIASVQAEDEAKKILRMSGDPPELFQLDDYGDCHEVIREVVEIDLEDTKEEDDKKKDDDSYNVSSCTICGNLDKVCMTIIVYLTLTNEVVLQVVLINGHMYCDTCIDCMLESEEDETIDKKLQTFHTEICSVCQGDAQVFTYYP